MAKAKKTFDISDFTPNMSDITVSLKTPDTGEDMGMEWVLCSPNSKEYKAVLAEFADKRLKKAKDTKDATQDISIKELEDAQIETYAKVTKSWTVVFGGQTPEVTVEKAKEILEKFPWIKNQIDIELAVTSSFTKA